MSEENALPPHDKEMTLVQHLLELRDALTKGIIAIIVLFICLFPFANELYIYISEPLTRFLPADTSMIATGVASPFLTPFKLSLVLAVYIAMPFLLYQVWSFIAPALYKHERQLVAPLLFFSSFLFYAGGAFAFYVVFPLVFGFLSTTAPDGVTIATDIALYLDFVIKMFFAFGLAFEVPIVVVLLILTGMVSPEKLSHIRPYIIVGAFVIGMLLTPPDIISQTLLAVPMWLLYEAGIIVGAAVKKARSKKEQAESEEPSKENTSSTGQDMHEKVEERLVETQDDDYDPMYDDDDYDPYEVDEEYQYDDRYADQVNDDLDWDDEFDKIDNEFSELERQYAEKQKAKKDAKKDSAENKNNKDSNKESENKSNSSQPEKNAPESTKPTDSK